VSLPIIYLDYAAAAPLDKRVFKVMKPYFEEQFYNPSAPYQPARDIRNALEDARARISRLLGAKPAEIIFTAGATESINLAFSGILKTDTHCVVSSIDHAAVLKTAGAYDHTIVQVDRTGRISLEDIEAGIGDNTTLVSIGMVNNEIGVVQDIKRIAELIANIRNKRQNLGNSMPLYFHTDATQAAGSLDLSVSRLGVDLLTVGGNKIYGPKQAGLLYKGKLALQPIIRGGGQELDLRSGTENVAGIMGLSEAFTIALNMRQNETKRQQQLKTFFVNQLVELLPDTVAIGNQKHVVPHIMMLSWPGLDGERLMFRLESDGVLVNTGAACAARKEGYSHVLKALGLTTSLITGSLRFSFGRETNEKQLGRAVKIIVMAIKQERGQ
jgi:cysteine desulfurase